MAVETTAMKYQVTITETYSYQKEIICKDESELQDILHEDVPLLVDMDKEDLRRIRNKGMDFKTEFEW